MRCFRKWLAGYGVILALTLLAAHWGNQAVTVMAERTPIHRNHTIIIDAGHGGIDGGATSCSGRLESGLNLEISLRLEELLHFLGYSTRMIRREDISVYTEGQTIRAQKMSDLKNRIRAVNGAENGILLSIHQNLFPDSRYSGAQVFYAPTDGSEELAKAMQEAFRQRLGSRREVKKSSGVYLMEHIERPGILIECGFLSNPQEEALLCSSGYQKKLAAVIVCTAAVCLSAQ